MMSRGEDHLLNTIQVCFSLEYNGYPAVTGNKFSKNVYFLNLKLLNQAKHISVLLPIKSQSKCLTDWSIGSGVMIGNTNTNTNYYVI